MILGVSKSTMRRWEEEGRIKSERTPGDILGIVPRLRPGQMVHHPMPTAGRVHDQQADWERQEILFQNSAQEMVGHTK